MIVFIDTDPVIKIFVIFIRVRYFEREISKFTSEIMPVDVMTAFSFCLLAYSNLFGEII